MKIDVQEHAVHLLKRVNFVYHCTGLCFLRQPFLYFLNELLRGGKLEDTWYHPGPAGPKNIDAVFFKGGELVYQKAPRSYFSAHEGSS